MIARILLALLLLVILVLTAKSQTREEFQYDDMGRVSRYRVVQGAQAYVVSYEYDKRSNITRTRSEVVSGVDDTDSKLSIVVRPNPTSTEVTIEAPATAGSMVTFVISSPDSRTVLSESVPVDATGVARLTLDAAKHNLASGSYHVKTTSGATSTTAAFVVTR